MVEKEKTWHEAIQIVLGRALEPLSAAEIAEEVIALELRKSFGATPTRTVEAQLALSIKNKGENSPYRRVSKGYFVLADKPGGEIVQPDTEYSDTGSSQIVSSFGMFWQREKVDFESSTVKLLGCQQGASIEVDFSNQDGVYLLYDGREIIYVGRTTSGNLGARLKAHTANRLAVRWDRFSWFGLKPVNEGGQLGDLPVSVSTQSIVELLESLLIEALEPRQNRKRGDDLSSYEYLQVTDEDLERRIIKKKLQDML